MGGGNRVGGANHCPYPIEILERSLRWCCHCWGMSRNEKKMIYGEQ